MDGVAEREGPVVRRHTHLPLLDVVLCRRHEGLLLGVDLTPPHSQPHTSDSPFAYHPSAEVSGTEYQQSPAPVRLLTLMSLMAFLWCVSVIMLLPAARSHS